MSTTAISSSRGSTGSEEVEVSGRGRGIRRIDLPAVFTTPEECEMLSLITAFDLSRNELQELTNLQPLRSLVRLNASYNHIYRFDGLPLRLTQLNLAHNKLEHLDSVGQLTHLRTLDVSFNRLTSLAGLTPRVQLEVLKADDNRIERTLGLEGLQTLQVISLSNNYIEDMDELLFLPTTPSLQLLSLAGNPVTRVRRYRTTVAQLQRALVTLDGAPLVREDAVGDTSRLSSTPQGGRGAREAGMSRSSRLSRMTATVSTMPTRSSSHLRNAQQHPQQEGRPTHQDLMRGAHDSFSAAAEHQRSLNTSGEHRTATATQTMDATTHTDTPSNASLDNSSVTPRVEPPRPAAAVRRDAASGDTLISASPTPSRGVSASTAAGVHPRVAAPRTQRHPQVGEKRMPRQRKAAAASASPQPPSSVTPSYHPNPDTSPSPAEVAEDSEEAQPADQEADDLHADADPPSATPASPGSGQRVSQLTRSGGGYASLYATAAGSATPQRASSNNNNNTFSSSTHLGVSRFARQPIRSPASPQRSAASQELDAAAAQLYESLSEKEHLRRECQTLFRKVKHMEGQLSEARRVISQQLADLAQLRLERDALRQSESDAMERLEKEKRAAKARAGHHAEEGRTLLQQYERMKTFYEAQLADTRRELSAERARLLQRAKVSGNSKDHEQQQEEEASVRVAVVGEERRSSTRHADPPASTSPRSRVAVSSSQRCPSPPAESPAPHADVGCHSGSAADGAAEKEMMSSLPIAPAHVVTRQLAAWCHGALTATRDGASTSSNQAEEQSTADDQSVEFWKQVLQERQPSPPLQRSAADCSPPAAAVAARKLLEDFIASHTSRTESVAEADSHVHPAAVGATAGTPTSASAPSASVPPSSSSTTRMLTAEAFNACCVESSDAAPPLQSGGAPDAKSARPDAAPPPPLSPPSPAVRSAAATLLSSAVGGPIAVGEREGDGAAAEATGSQGTRREGEDRTEVPPALAQAPLCAVAAAAVTHGQRVCAAKALLKEMESMFDGAS
ncbi:hypothetical protein ABL78_5520 [Leptomonas seymouri]|uniref:Leucine-rich repeat protein n=1 Tax=Leptomonas seymouri TaxID=5684 RepID=A0A0N1I4Q0_LEPSE|nr:hypothetical protein ABL78_5520 [Leptomonas seymouri]|eukprot:KPI85430.1 hypothetical protein ABL78_5520 [Leptomonas seymouri]